MTDALYADYTISADEDAENVTCVFRFYKGSSEGATLVLEPPSAVLLDGMAVPVDSAGLSGAYYEVQRPLAQFAGMHTIRFKNAEGKAFKETFTFQPFAISEELGETVLRGDLSIRFDGLPARAPLRVSLIDTSFATPDINDIDTVQNGALIVTQEAMRKVVSGPVTLHLYHEEERRLQHPPGAGGKLSITYGLSREFDLVDE
jgi:hypothetical protein